MANPAHQSQQLFSDFHVIIVPGLHNSGPGHWQTLWQQANPDFVRVQQNNWDYPRLDEWVHRLDMLRAKDPRPALLVAHSFGCLTAACSAARNPDGVASLLLVAPAHPDRFGVAAALPKGELPAPSLLVSSANDPWMPAVTAAQYAARWGSELVEGGLLGHINADSGLGEWPDGQRLLRRLAEKALEHQLEAV